MEVKETSASSARLQPLHSDAERRWLVDHLYNSLKSWETRLLSLDPGGFHDPLSATLHVAVITHHLDSLGLVETDGIVTFEALSYTWGGETLSHPLICNGLTIGITYNLFTALRYLRDEKDCRYLWVDAVCINQLDNEEKSRQIRILQIIFEHAIQVVAWLGEEGQHTQAAFDVLRAWVLEYPTSEQAEEMRLLLESKSKTDFEDIDNALLDLLTRPWLSRVWIIQEIYAAKKLKVLCGSCVIDWEDFCKIQYCRYHWNRLDLDKQEFSMSGSLEMMPSARIAVDSMDDRTSTAIKFLRSIRDQKTRYRRARLEKQLGNLRPLSLHPEEDHNARHFYDLLRSAFHLKATDPRDRLWALAGISRIPIVYGSSSGGFDETVAININYDKPVAQAYAEATRFFLCSLRHAASLLDHGRCNHGVFPSWSLDFESKYLPQAQESKASPPVLTPKLGTKFAENRNPQPDPAKISLLASGVSQKKAWSLLARSGWHIGTVCALQSSNEEFDEELTGVKYRIFRHGGSTVMGPDHGYRYGPNWHPPTVVVKPTPCLKSWLLHAASQNEVHYKMPKGPNSAKERMQLVPQEEFAEYVEETRPWGVHGMPAVEDLVIQMEGFSLGFVLRKQLNGCYTYIGRARPMESLGPIVVRGVKSYPGVQAMRGAAELAQPRKASDGDQFEEQQIFHIC